MKRFGLIGRVVNVNKAGEEGSGDLLMVKLSSCDEGVLSGSDISEVLYTDGRIIALTGPSCPPAYLGTSPSVRSGCMLQSYGPER